MDQQEAQHTQYDCFPLFARLIIVPERERGVCGGYVVRAEAPRIG
jgi:hypothetical protein